MTPLRILLVCMQYPTGAGQSGLTTELADALAAAGHRVEVLWLDWAGAADGDAREAMTASGVRVVRCPPRKIGRGRLGDATKFVLSGCRAALVARRHFDLARLDVMIAWMPALAIAPLVPLATRAGIRHRLLFVWDFFPDHHREIGRVPAGLPYRVARWCEQRLLGGFTAILCTLPGNAAYLRHRYRVRPDQRVRVTPVWCDTTPLPAVDRHAVRARHGLPPDRPIAVFGGQIVEGRGFDQMLAAADTAAAAGSALHFLFVGDGRLAPVVAARAAVGSNVALRPPMPRAAYLDLLGACDVGMAATVPGVTSFSIPSKTLDYLRAGLPVVCALEPGNELAGILERYDVGSAVPFGDAVGFFRAAERLARNRPDQAARCLDDLFDVRHAVAAVLEAARDQPAGSGGFTNQASVTTIAPIP